MNFVALLALIGAFALGALLIAKGYRTYVAGTRALAHAQTPIGSVVGGEVRVTGRVVPAGVTIRSSLAGVDCVYYRAAIEWEGSDNLRELDEERSVSFHLEDDSGSIRVLPRGAEWMLPWRWEDEMEARPEGPRRFRREARLEPFEQVTLVGTAMRHAELPESPLASELRDQAALRYREPNVLYGTRAQAPIPMEDPEIAADLAAAQAAGTFQRREPAFAGWAPSPGDESGWGNAVIPGFGIGRPTRPPTLDPAASVAAPAATVGEAQPAPDSAGGAQPVEKVQPPDAEGTHPVDPNRLERDFSIAPDQFVLASTPDAPLLVYPDDGSAANAQPRDGLLLAAAGLALTIGSLTVTVLMLAGVIRF